MAEHSLPPRKSAAATAPATKLPTRRTADNSIRRWRGGSRPEVDTPDALGEAPAVGRAHEPVAVPPDQRRIRAPRRQFAGGRGGAELDHDHAEVGGVAAILDVDHDVADLVPLRARRARLERGEDRRAPLDEG